MENTNKINLSEKIGVVAVTNHMDVINGGRTLYGFDTEAYANNNAMSEYGYRYELPATDEEGNEYLIVWEVTNPDAENEDERCDWDNYTVIEK